MKDKQIIETAKKEFPHAINDVEAVDLLAQKYYRELRNVKNTDKRFPRLSARYLETRALHHELRNRMYVRESEIAREDA